MNAKSKLLLGSLALLASTAVLADPGAARSDPDESGWITVLTPRLVRRPVDAKNDQKNELVSLTHRVSYVGLDLAMHADVMELEKRINESAETGCDQLAALSPLIDLDTASCVRAAVRDAMERAEKLVAAAIDAYQAG